MRSAPRLLVGLLLFFAAACGGVSDNDDDTGPDGDADSDGDGDGDGDGDADADADGDADGDADLTLEELCDQVGDALCEAAESCCLEGWTAEDLGICVESFSLNCQGSMNAAIARGDIVIDPTAVPACLDAFSSSWGACSPSGPEGGPPACDRVFRGQLAEGAACDNDESCTEGLECTYTPEGSLCRRLPGDGDPCLDGQCARDHRCAYDTNLCFRMGEEGAGCRMVDPGSDTCREHLFCGDNGVCVMDFGPGHLCGEHRQCFSNFCDSQNGVNGVCGGGGEPTDYCDPVSFAGR